MNQLFDERIKSAVMKSYYDANLIIFIIEVKMNSYLKEQYYPIPSLALQPITDH